MKNTEMNYVDDIVKYSDHIEVFELNNKLTRTYALDIKDGPKLFDILFKKIDLDEESHTHEHAGNSLHHINVQKFLHHVRSKTTKHTEDTFLIP